MKTPAKANTLASSLVRLCAGDRFEIFPKKAAEPAWGGCKSHPFTLPSASERSMASAR